MGADLITAHLATKRKLEDLDFEAGKRFVDDMTNTEVQEGILNSDLINYLDPGVDPDSPTDEDILEARDHAKARIDSLSEAVQHSYRDLAWFVFGEWLILTAGGTSWGDSPGETFDAINALWEIPGALEAIGFEWPEYARTQGL